MRIAIWHDLPSGGGKRALYEHVRGLVGRGHYVEAWCPTIAAADYLPLSDLIQEHRLALPVQQVPRSINGLARPYRQVVDRLFQMDQHCRECAAQIEAGGFDLLFANACQWFRVTSIGRHVSLPSVLYLQEPYRNLYEALPRLPWLALPERQGHWTLDELTLRLRDAAQNYGLRIQARDERDNAAAFDTILANSFFSRESILRAYGLDAKVCYLGIDTDTFVRRDVSTENEIVGLGAFVPEKNIEFCIRAVSMVAPPRPRLIWIGNAANLPYLESLRRLADEREVIFEPRVRIPDDELVSALSRAFVFVYAARLEPFGLAPLEAGACRLPVIAVAEGGVRETVFDEVNGLLVENDPGAMAAAIERLRDEPAFARELGATGQRLVYERWSAASATDRLERRLIETFERRSTGHRQNARTLSPEITATAARAD